MDEKQKVAVIETITATIRNKFKTYNPEPASMPFHTRLLGCDRMALYSFIHSLATNFGTTIFEPVAKSLASLCFASAESQQIAGKQISSEAQRVIQNIMDKLSTASTQPNKPAEIQAIRDVCQNGKMIAVKPTRVDIKLIGRDGTIYLIDIKTAKPNVGEFKGFKRTLLEWVAATLATNPEANVETLIAIPYNPYEPEPYSRWTMRGMIDLENELKVADEFWDFIGGEGTYDDLLKCFEQAGIELRNDIDTYFKKFLEK
ncbi:TdeIII family type II restriction endonuclease [Deferribacterales bacterium RsTz2092]|nr:TdeIII family type II restriction endonuclease [Deferribacterales bacterium]